ncbi:hypothetical protein GOBAR_DD21201 [Gossypium barbadense]|nr:hypothetical protein GOBAR_DD21201 [Gossypium barbadense]
MGRKVQTRSWKSPDDPSDGNFFQGIEPFSIPEESNRRYVERIWDAGKGDWINGYSSYLTGCDVYGKFGAFGFCDSTKRPICSCLKGFKPRNIEEWSSGFFRTTPLHCQRDNNNGSEAGQGDDGFLKLKKIKVPAFPDQSPITNGECKDQCMKNCSCVAYEYDAGIGCMLWSGDLIDVQKFSNRGVDLYIRLPSSERDKRNSEIIVITTVNSGMVVIIIISALFLLRRMGQQIGRNKRRTQIEDKFHGENIGESSIGVNLQQLPLFNFEELATATNNFHPQKKLGQGDFGPVYKGTLDDGNESTKFLQKYGLRENHQHHGMDIVPSNPPTNCCRVANRNRPLKDFSGILTISDDGNLVVSNGKAEILWSTNVTNLVPNATTAQLLDSGNLVLNNGENGGSSILWESFQHPSNVFLQTMKISTDVKTGRKVQTRSGKSPDDPSDGNFVQGIEPFSIPEDDVEKTYYETYEYSTDSRVIYYELESNGRYVERIWDAAKGNWINGYSSYLTDCDVYGKCGAFGICDSTKRPICSCLKGFKPRNIEEWSRGNWSSGCFRTTPLHCQRDNNNGCEAGQGDDGFLKLKKMKVPAFPDQSSITNGECKDQCMKNCSCVAYAYDAGIGCMLWSGDLIDVQKFSNRGVDLYIRLTSSELGTLDDGKEIAVKRLSKASGQGLEEFMNEVAVISKLQHRNLVKLFGCCVEAEEKMLVYEFMPNKSLDAFLFGISRGLLYLYRDSRLKIIHRDLKASNLLLDQELNPKISDFGIARIFGGDENQANTKRVVGTYGYMSHEYAMHGRFSEKSNMFSYEVLLLEIVSGRRNTSFYNKDDLSLLGYGVRFCICELFEFGLRKLEFGSVIIESSNPVS